MKSRVLYICGARSFHSQKPLRKITSIIECWQRLGHEVLLVCGGDILDGSGDGSDKEYGDLLFYRKWYRRIGIFAPLIRTVSERRDIEHDAAMERHLEGLCDSFKPDVVWGRSCRLHCAGLIAARRIGVPYVLEWKDNLVPSGLSWYRSRALEMEKCKNREADYVVVESQVLLEALARDGVDRNKIIVAHNAVDAEQFGWDKQARLDARKALGVEVNEVLVGYLGSYAFYHDAARLVLSADILQNKGSGKIKFLMVGAGKEYPEARRIALQRRLLDTILTMKPGVPAGEVPDVLAAIDIAVLPGSTDIICPIKIQEYMASELPVVAPDYACNAEVIDDGRTGMLFTPKDEHSLAEKISILAKDGEMRRRLGQQAREEVQRRFTWEKTWGAALEETLRRIYS